MLCLAAAVMLSSPLPAVDKMEARARDWRIGPVVYQIFVDRFAPSDHLDAKRGLYAAPRSLHPWDETPKGGTLNREAGLWSHELAFWGGDLQSVRSKVGYIKDLGVDVVYLNPIVQALSNHKYDAQDYKAVAPEYGTRADVASLAKDLHAKGMRLMLDGVFNHMGRTSPALQSAIHDPKSPYRDWFFVGPEYPGGYRAWIGVANLPELRLENKKVRDYLWNAPDSVVQGYLKEGVDGWRLDTAFELGPRFLAELTTAAHRARPDSVVVGEVWNYPEFWFPALDGIMNFHAGKIVQEVANGSLEPARAGRMLETMVSDAGIEPILRSWIVLDNHDTDRLVNLLPNPDDRHLARALQFTLPGAPVVYYGSEVGMSGAGDPGSRGPMRWDLVTAKNPDLVWTKKLLAMRKKRGALRYGDFRRLESGKTLAFLRLTGHVADTVLVVANPSAETVRETIPIRDGRIMNGTLWRDELSSFRITTFSGLMNIEIPPKTVRILTPQTAAQGGYTPYKRLD